MARIEQAIEAVILMDGATLRATSKTWLTFHKYGVLANNSGDGGTLHPWHRIERVHLTPRKL